MDQHPHIKKSHVIKRSILINGHKTSVSLENEFWQGLREIADHNYASVAMLVEQIDHDRNTCNLSSAIRVFVFKYFQEKFANCSECGTATQLFGIEAERPGYELRTFVCPNCKHIETAVGTVA